MTQAGAEGEKRQVRFASISMVSLRSLRYLATWQGLRGEDLDIDLEGQTVVVCSRFGQAVVFSAATIIEAEQE